MALDSLPEMAVLSENYQINKIAHRRRLTREEAYQLAYDDAMGTLAEIHFESLFAYNVRQNEKRNAPKE